MQQDHDFSAPSTTNASLTIPNQASQLSKGDYVLIKGHPCRIASKSTSKPGKHGHAKVSFEAYDIFTHKKYEEMSPAHANVEVPVVVKREYLVLDVDGGYLSLWDRDLGATKDDVKVPEGEVGKRVAEVWKRGGKDVLVVVVWAMGMEMVDGVKEVEGQ